MTTRYEPGLWERRAMVFADAAASLLDILREALAAIPDDALRNELAAKAIEVGLNIKNLTAQCATEEGKR